MEVSALQPKVHAADLPLETLAGNHSISESEKVGELSRQFEAVLLRQILASAQKTVFASKMNPESSATAIYRDMVTNQLADSISHSRALGLGDSLAQQLGRQLKTDGDAKS
jgi:peptidoglycan hydrolase FlgJ